MQRVQVLEGDRGDDDPDDKDGHPGDNIAERAVEEVGEWITQVEGAVATR